MMDFGNLLLVALSKLSLLGLFGNAENPVTVTSENPVTIEETFLFESDGLNTNTALADINLSEVIDGGPGKDGIPALNDPQYVSVSEAEDWYTNDSQGILIDLKGDQRWISYDILYWHEIVNDTIGGVPVAVTFCPLCGSAITFDRQINDQNILNFGVSGKIWQSNLLMYDTKTESLWSQIEGTAKVGEFNGETLEILDSQVTKWQDVKDIQDLKVLSHETGFDREYGRAPYGTYENDTELYFPVANVDDRLHPKTIMIAGEYQSVPFAIERFPLIDLGSLEVIVADQLLQIESRGGQVTVTDPDGNSIPTFNTMWFSWANHWLSDEAFVWSQSTPETIAPEPASVQYPTIIEFFSYGCSFCDQVHDALNAAKTDRPEVNIDLRHFVIYEAYLPIHRGQVCAAEQDLGYEFHHQYFDQHYPRRQDHIVNTIATTIGLDQSLLDSCLASDRPDQKITNDMRWGAQLGVRGTPTLISQSVDGQLGLLNARTKEAFVTSIDALKK